MGASKRISLAVSGLMAILAVLAIAFVGRQPAGRGQRVADPRVGGATSNPAGSAAVAPDTREPPPSAAAVEPAARRSEARRRRDRMLEGIHRALDQRHAAAGPREYRAEVEGEGLSQEYVQAQLERELIPGARSCYNQMLLVDPDYSGSLQLHFTVVADEDLGGVVETVSPGEDRDIDDERMLGCLEEKMYEVTFDPPETGGTLRVTYPLEFEPG